MYRIALIFPFSITFLFVSIGNIFCLCRQFGVGVVLAPIYRQFGVVIVRIIHIWFVFLMATWNRLWRVTMLYRVSSLLKQSLSCLCLLFYFRYIVVRPYIIGLGIYANILSNKICRRHRLINGATYTWHIEEIQNILCE